MSSNETRDAPAAAVHQGGPGPAELPSYPTGFSRVLTAMKARSSRLEPIEDEPAWNPDFTTPLPDVPCLRLRDFGYPSTAGRRGTPTDDAAFAGPLRILSDEGAGILAGICERLERSSVGNSFIISQRLRGADRYSRFIHDMLRDKGFLINLSRIAGVPLIAHPIRDAAAQVNFYGNEGTGNPTEEIAKWHVDGMNYVFNVLLTDKEQFEGGDFLYFKGTKEEFERHAPGWKNKVRRSESRKIGDTIFARGSRIYHAVTPVTRGRRVSIILSMFCPYLPENDVNSFWHVAGDDGVVRTLSNWRRFKSLDRSPERFFRETCSPPIGWADIRE